jgi:hypothetical protein
VPHLEELGLANELSFVQEEKTEATVASTKTEKITTQPIVKTTPAEKEKPVVVNETKPAEPVMTETVSTKPVVKKNEIKTVAKEQPANKPAEIKSTPVAKQNAVNPDTVAKPVQPAVAKVVKPAPEKISPVTTAASDLGNRTIETIQSVNYRSDSLVLTLYDNGEIDGDTVSVLMNGKVIMPMVGLTTNAVRKVIYTKDLPDSIQIVMYAETLGSLPPNTGLLIVYDGTERYEIRFSGDLKKNAAIVFRRKEN